MEEILKKIEDYLFKQNYERSTNNFEDFLSRLESANGFGIGKRITADNPALIEVTSNKEGVRFSRMTETERDNILVPGAGLLIYNTTQGIYNQHNGTYWSEIGIPKYTTVQRDALTVPSGAHPLIYNTTTNKLNIYTTAWEQITSA